MWQAVRSQCHLGSALFRHAVRLSIVVFLAGLLVELFQIEQGYWILLTAILVCQPNYSATKKRLVQRIIGTVLGVVVGMSLRYLSPTLEAQLGLIVASGSLFFLFRTNNYSFSTFFITLQVLVSFDVVGLGANSAMLPRILDTLIGVGIAWLAVTYLWPDWKYLNLHSGLKETLKQSATYLRHILAQLQFGYRDDLAYRSARRSAQNALAGLSTVVSNMTNEPKKYRTALTFAPNLLGLSYTLMSYISALGAQRLGTKETHACEVDIDFFRQGKQIASLLGRLAEGKVIGSDELNAMQHRLQALENRSVVANARAITLLQQLRLIIELLPLLCELVERGQCRTSVHAK